MPSQVTNYQCPACTGGLHFSSDSGRLECEYCGSSYSVAEIEALYAEKEAAAAKAADDAKQTSEQKDAAWETSGTADWDDENMKSYSCPSCGAELVCDATTAATCCPYCGNPTIVPGQLHGLLKPDFVIPFRLDKDAATAALKAHYKKKFFLPKVFSAENHIQELQGVYVPFWLFDAEADADCSFQATRTHSHRSGDYEITTTDHFHVRRAGSMSFSRIPADGSSKMPDDYMDSLEPFDYQELKPFSTAYLPGFLADKYDVSAKDCAPRAESRVRATAQDLMRDDVHGYTTVTPTGNRTVIRKGTVHYAMLPVWMLHTKWNDTSFLFAMNGQTGKLVGNLPVDRRKFLLTLFGGAVALAALLVLTGAAGWLGEQLQLLFS